MVQIGLEFAIESNFAGLNVEVEATLINSRMSSDWNYSKLWQNTYTLGLVRLG